MGGGKLVLFKVALKLYRTLGNPNFAYFNANIKRSND